MARSSSKVSRVAAATWKVAARLGAWIGWRRAVLGAVVVLGPIVALNVLVAVCGRTVVFPLSPYNLRSKARALGLYVAHRPHCLVDGHPPIDTVIARAEARHRLPTGLLAALIQVESEGRPHRISPVGAMGPGQITPSTARALGIDDPFDTVENVDASARYLAQQLGHFHDIRLALAAYNAGPGAVAASHAVPRNGETEIYVERVLRIRRVTAAPIIVRGHPPVGGKSAPVAGLGETKASPAPRVSASSGSARPSTTARPVRPGRRHLARAAEPTRYAEARNRPRRRGPGSHVRSPRPSNGRGCSKRDPCLRG